MGNTMFYTLDLSAKELTNNKFFRRPEAFAEARRVSSKLSKPINIYLWNAGFKAPVSKVMPDGSFQPFIPGENSDGSVKVASALVCAAQVMEELGKKAIATSSDELIATVTRI